MKKRAKYQDVTPLPPESFEDGKVVGIVNQWGQHQHTNLYIIDFKFKMFSKLMLPLAEVVHFLLDEDVDAKLAPTTDETDRNHTSCPLHMLPDSEPGACPESGGEGDDFNLSNEDDCIRINADSDNFTWHRRKQGDFAFMEQVLEDEFPSLRADEVTQDLTLDWVEEGTLSEPNDKMKDTPGC
jgi:hypothetical protein